jgi:hypothetical protein
MAASEVYPVTMSIAPSGAVLAVGDKRIIQLLSKRKGSDWVPFNLRIGIRADAT